MCRTTKERGVDMVNTKTFAMVFNTLREDYKLSQVEIAKRLNVAQSTIGMWETGKRIPSYEKMEEIADYFNVDIDYLYGRQSEPRRLDLSTPIVSPAMSNDETLKDVIKYYTMLNDNQKQVILNTMKVMLNL